MTVQYQRFIIGIIGINAFTKSEAEAEVPAFQAEMEKLALPMEEKGVDTMVEALNTAKKLKMRDGTIARVQKELDKLNMKPVSNEVIEISTPDIVVPQYKQKVVGS